MNKFIVITAPGIDVQVDKQISIYCNRENAYIMPDQTNFELEIVNWRKFEKERNDWIRKYDNLLKGLQYWKEKALENE